MVVFERIPPRHNNTCTMLAIPSTAEACLGFLVLPGLVLVARRRRRTIEAPDICLVWLFRRVGVLVSQVWGRELPNQEGAFDTFSGT